MSLPRLLAGVHAGQTEPQSLGDHRSLHGPLPSPEGLINEVEAAGLRGRGGADFPTALKLRALERRRRGTILVANGSETEPASEKDALLMKRLPHLVLDGAELVAHAIGSREIHVRAGDGESERAVSAAAAERSLPVTVHPAAEGYVGGEETAVIAALGGRRGIPTYTPPRPFERGLRGRPTLVQNVETLAQIALIARHGAGWYRQVGTDEDPGTVLVTVGGAVRRPGVLEIAFGTSLDAVLDAAGGSDEPLEAILIGGYFGAWLSAGMAHRIPLARADLLKSGTSLGSGVLLALGRSGCGLHETARIVDYLASQSAGQCGPCHHGLPAIADALWDSLEGKGGSARVRSLCGEVKGRGACHHPDGTVRLVESALRVFGRHEPGGCRRPDAGFPLPEAAAS